MQIAKPFALAAALLFPLAVQAESYVGGSYARARNDGGPFDGSSNGYSLYVGSYNRTVGLEGGYVSFGKLGGGDGPHAQAWVSSVMLGFTFFKYFAPFAKGGLAISRLSATPITEEARNYRFYYGGGLRFGGNDGFGLRAEYERYRLGDNHVDLLSAGLEYRF